MWVINVIPRIDSLSSWYPQPVSSSKLVVSNSNVIRVVAMASAEPSYANDLLHQEAGRDFSSAKLWFWPSTLISKSEFCAKPERQKRWSWSSGREATNAKRLKSAKANASESLKSAQNVRPFLLLLKVSLLLLFCFVFVVLFCCCCFVVVVVLFCFFYSFGKFNNIILLWLPHWSFYIMSWYRAPELSW